MTDVEIEQAVTGFRDLADWWANRIQWSEEDHEDLVQEGLFSLFKTLKGYQKSGKPIENLSGLANTVLSSTMKWYYKPADRETTKVPIEVAPIPVLGVEEYFSEIMVKEYINEVGRVLGPAARTIVENLISPTPVVIDIATREMQSKAERKAKGERVVGHSTLRVTKEHIRKAANLTEGQWLKEILGIQTFTRTYLEAGEAPRRGRSLGKTAELPALLVG